MTPATVVIVGAGRLAEAHARVVVAHPDLRLVGIIEPDAVAGATLVERIVNRFEGERAPLFSDLASALSELDVDLVAMGDGAAPEFADAVLAAGKAVVGGSRTDGRERWFAFHEASAADGQGSADAAFGENLRQYEDVLRVIGHGPQVQAGGGA